MGANIKLLRSPSVICDSWRSSCTREIDPARTVEDINCVLHEGRIVTIEPTGIFKEQRSSGGGVDDWTG